MTSLLKPDVVVLGMYSNDFSIRPNDEYGIEFEHQREQAASAFRVRFPWAYLAVKNSALVEFTKQVLLNGSAEEYYMRLLRGEMDEDTESRRNAMTEELESFRELSLRHSFLPLVLTNPARIQVQQLFPNSQYPARIHEICDRLELRCVDVFERFAESLRNGSDPYLQWDNHLSTVGHASVAVALGEKIKIMVSESRKDS